MRIRRIEIFGFKSFPERTLFELGGGVSCIVGPNGCGKSNVFDAVQWCVGEQSARRLRGQEMSDVIFAGSAARAPVGFAQVALTFTAASGEPFPAPYAHLDELEVSRRLYRKGGSEYAINGTRCRRRDLVDLFRDTGIGSEQYSFIGQGRISEIVHAHPDERRNLIDEAAGISRYKARRKEALSRLEQTATQLDRAADVVEELERRLGPLRRQVIRAARHRRIRARIRQREIFLGLAKFADLAADRRAVRARLRQGRTELGAAERERARRQADVAQRREELEVARSSADTWRDEVAEADARRRELASELAFVRRGVEEAKDACERAGKAEAAAMERCASGEAELAEAAAKVQALDRARGEAELASQTAQGHAERAGEAAAAAVVAAEQAEAEHADAVATLAASQARRKALEAALQTHHEEAAARQQELEALGEAAEDTGDFAGLESERARAAEALAAAQEQVDERAATQQRVDAQARRLRDVARDGRQRAEALGAGVAGVSAAMRGVTDRVRSDGADEVERARHEAREAVERATGALNRAVAGGEQVVRRAEAGARDRGQRWVRAAEAFHTAEQDRRLEGMRIELDQAAAQRSEDLGRARAEVVQAIDEAGAAADAEGEAERTAVEVDRRRAEEELDRVREARAVARSALAAAVEDEEVAAAALAEARAAEHAALRSTAGSAAVRDALPRARALAEQVDLTKRADDARRVGERASLLVLDDVDDVLRAAAAAREAGASARILLRRDPAGDPVDQLFVGAQIVEDLRAALLHFRSTGQPGVTVDGERVDAAGVVVVGGGDGARIVGLRQTREDAEGEAEACVVRRQQRVLDERRAAGAVEDAEAELEATSERARTVLEAQLGRRQQARELARRDGEERIARLLVTHRAAAEDGRMRMRHREQDLRNGVASTLRAARQDLERGVKEARERARGRVEADTADATAALEAAKVKGAAAVAEAQRCARSALEAASDRAAALAVRLDGDLTEARREADEAATAAEDADRRAQEARASLATASQVAGSAREAWRTADEAVQAMRIQVQLAGERAIQLRGETARDEERAATLKKAIEDHVAGDRSQGRWEEAVGALDEARAARAGAESDSSDARAAATRAAAEVGRMQERLVAAEAAVTAGQGVKLAAEQDRAAVTAERERWMALHEERRAKAGALAADVEAQDGVLTKSSERLAEARELVKRLSESQVASERAAGDSEAAVRTATEAVAGFEEQLRDIRGGLEQLREQVEARYEVSLPGLLDRLDALGEAQLDAEPGAREDRTIGETVVEGVGPMVIRADAVRDSETVKREVAELEADRRRFSALGEVNLLAADEYGELCGRRDDLVVQRSDLEDAVARIRAAIAKMNRTCRQRFRDAFDRVNEEFQAIYPRLVGGGNARLSLTDDEDLLETGVDIFVRPPGKRLQNLSLLSGGEKAMAALSLVVALFRVRPSPLCMMDEVDAPLDEANGARFNEVLAEMAGVAQFIVITHNRKTMESADTLYGVTMADPGVSRLVSVRMG